jgi:tetratricopeptide (TPR) repeat protein
LERIQEELLALLEGELGPDDAKRIEALIASSEPYRREHAWLKAAYADLDAMGRAFSAKSPQVDLVNAVMATVAEAERPKKVASIDAERARRRERGRTWLGVAAAAAIVFALLGYAVLKGMSTHDATGPGLEQLTQNPPDAPGNQSVEPTPDPDTVLAGTRQQFMDKYKEFRDDFNTPDASESVEPTESPVLDAPSIGDIVTARREASGDSRGISRLVQWASLKKEQALDLAQSQNSTPQVIVGAAQSLTGQEAAQILLTAVGQLPDDPNARLELAKAFDEAPEAGSEGQALEQLPSLYALDPENALPYYLEAKLRLEQNDLAGALEALRIAEGLPRASAYSLESAIAKAEALIASGLPADEARLVSALTAGMDQYNFLCDLGKNLLEYGQDYMAAGDYDTARGIVEAVQRLGQQAEQGANFSQEQLAGLDMQAAAIDVLEEIYTAIEYYEGIGQLTTQTRDLVASIDQLGGFFDALDQLFFSEGSSDFFNMISGWILQSGDLDIFTYLQGMGISLDGAQ